MSAKCKAYSKSKLGLKPDNNKLALISEKKFDKAIFEYVKWRNESDALIEYRDNNLYD